MKTSLSVWFALLLLVPAVRATDSTLGVSKPRPRLGMTQARVLALYGEPRHRARIDGQEVWFYRLKFAEVYGRAFVPFEFSSDNVTLGEIAFAPDGKVARVAWNSRFTATSVAQ